MIFLKNYFINTTKDVDVIPVLHDVRYAVRDSGASEGLATIIVPGAGAGVTIVTPLPEVLAELKEALKMFPGEGKEATTRRKEPVKVGAHVKAAMLGKSVSVPIKDGKPLIGSREEVVIVDFESDAKRREIFIQIMGEGGGGEGGQEMGMPFGMMGEE